jgi:hypothetical protein
MSMVGSWMAKLVGIGLVAAFTLTGSLPAKTERLDTVAWRVASALRRGDWKAFSKDAAPVLIIEERWRAYDSYFTKETAVRKPALGSADEFMLSHVTQVVTSRLSAKNAKVFTAFASMVRSAWDDNYASRKPELILDPVGEGHESIDWTAPAMVCTMVSNEDWVIELQQIDGRWKARRLLLMGH